MFKLWIGLSLTGARREKWDRRKVGKVRKQEGRKKQSESYSSAVTTLTVIIVWRRGLRQRGFHHNTLCLLNKFILERLAPARTDEPLWREATFQRTASRIGQAKEKQSRGHLTLTHTHTHTHTQNMTGRNKVMKCFLFPSIEHTCVSGSMLSKSWISCRLDTLDVCVTLLHGAASRFSFQHPC